MAILRIWLAAALAVAIRAAAGADVAVMEGDTAAEMYVNGVYTRVDNALPILPMNNIRVQLASGHTVKVYKTTASLQPGDVIGVKVTSMRPEVQPITDPLGELTNYSGYSGLIGALSDGTMTSEAWKCTQDHVEPEAPDEAYIPWHSKFFKGDDWPQAVLQPADCCPWRDPKKAWVHLNAQWISAPWYGNYTNNRLFYCRYKIPEDGPAHPQKLTVAEGARLPTAETVNSTLFFSPALGCQKLYDLLYGGCFRLYNPVKTYLAANADCKSSAYNGALASIDDEQQNTVLRSLAMGRPLLGLTDEAVEDEWRSASDGQLATYTNWNNSVLEPDGKRAENCAAMVYPSGQWGDVPCNSAFLYEGFICRSEACRDFSGSWTIDPYGYATENLTQSACSGLWVGKAAFDVLGGNLTLKSGKVGEMEVQKDRDRLLWDDRVVWTRHRASPVVTIVGLAVASSGAQVTFNVSRRARVSCDIIDARYLLRAPTARELEKEGVTKTVNPTAPGYKIVGNESTGLDYDVTVLSTHDVVIIEECEALCMKAYPQCVLMTFYLTGSDLATGRNCRLAKVFNESRTKGISPSAIFTHESLAERLVTHEIQIIGMVVPGAIYHAYCSTRDTYTGLHSTLAMIRDTQTTERADGALDSGSLNMPRVILLGGYASKTFLVPVAKASRPGRIFCAAKTLAEAPTGNWTAELIKADDMFSILVIANQSVPVEITGLLPSMKYEVACVADADGGAESTTEDIQATRRTWTTEDKAPTIASMIAEANPSPTKDDAQDISTYVQIVEKGYLWCIVLTSNTTLTLGVPRAKVIQSDGLRQKVEDLRQASAGSFPGFPNNITYEVYCTAEANDFSNETDSNPMKSPYPVASILTYEVTQDRLKLWVQVDRGPAAAHCAAFRWSDKPMSRRPTTDLIPSGAKPLEAPRVGNGLDLQMLLFESPYRFLIQAPGGGVAVFDIAPLATGSWFDVYCYAEELMEDVPAGAEPPPRQGMTPEAIRKTLLQIKTSGPSFEEGGWHCVAGRPCNISGLQGIGLTGEDRVLVRLDPCPGICQCNGKEDAYRKGGQCSPVSQDPAVIAPLPGERPDRQDPLGEWCYVDAGSCADGVKSKLFPTMILSYKVCSFNMPAGPWSQPQGFPQQGLAMPLTPSNSVKLTMHWLDLDCPRLTWWPVYVGAFELNLRQAFAVALGTHYEPEDLSFEYTVGTNYAECFVQTTIAVPVGVNAFDSRNNVRRAAASWLPEDILRRMKTVSLIRNVFVGYDHSVTLKSISEARVELDPIPGTAFGWGRETFVAPGNAYHLCYCNGTESSCITERAYRLEIGMLHMSGPTVAQAASTATCIGGLPCEVAQLGHYAAVNGSRLVVLPDSVDGCRWRRRSIGLARGAPGFLNEGVSDTATNYGATYIWGGGEPLVVASGFYVLCWCGPAPSRMRPDTELDVPYAEGGFIEVCPSVRPDDGEGYLAPAGSLRVMGPDSVGIKTCSIGLECIVQDVVGEGVRGGDRVAVLRVCGEEPPEADRFEWTTQGPGRQVTTTVTTTAWSGPGGANELKKWVEGGWIDYGPELSPEALDSIGLGGPTGRGMWGFPNRGISEPNARSGYYRWGGAVWAFAGDYQLCWCATGSGGNVYDSVLGQWRKGTGEWCTAPEHFLMPMGILRVAGPGVLPRSSQVFQCVRRRGCEISGYEGTMPEGSKLLIAEEQCGGPAKDGAPNGGQSLSTKDGQLFSWGTSGTFLDPGIYRLCWCASVITCFEPKDFEAYAGLLRIKAPLSPPRKRFCALGRECNVTGIYGPGLHNGDKVAVLPTCGAGEFTTKFTKAGISVRTYGLGQTYTLPPSLMYGTFRVCWCAGENVCSKGTDFDTDLGGLEVGGPDPSAIYVCFEWQPCSLTVSGSLLRDKDMLRLVPAGSDCTSTAASEDGPGLISGFPRNGVAFPSTGGGYSYSFGDDLVRATPGIYDLCYCSFEYAPGRCQNQTDFITPGGSLRIGNSMEYQYVTGPEGPKTRSNDNLYAMLLAILLPILFILAGVLGWGRNRIFAKLLGKSAEVPPEPEAPPIFKPRVGFSAAAQKKSKQMHEVRQVLEIRLAAPGFEGITKKASPKSAASISDVPDFRSDKAKQRAWNRERGVETDDEDEDDGEDEEEGGDRQAIGNLPTVPGTVSGAIAGFRKQASYSSQASKRSGASRKARALRDAARANGDDDDDDDGDSGGDGGGRRITGELPRGRNGVRRVPSSTERMRRDEDDRPEPPSINFANYKRSSKIWDLLEL